MTTILFCPCCASPVDAVARAEQVQQLDCPACGQQWWMVVDADRQAAHSLR